MSGKEARKILEQLTPEQRREVFTASMIINRYCKSENELERQASKLFKDLLKDR